MAPETLELTEYQTSPFQKDSIPHFVGEYVWSQFQKEIKVNPPSFLNDYSWQFTPQGWAGHVPIEGGYTLLIKPKVSISNLFQMLEYAYRIKFETSGGAVKAESLIDFYERLAHIFTKRVTDRVRKGLHQKYISHRQRLPFVRGKMDLLSTISQPWEVEIDCTFQRNTVNIEENQIVAWTLFKIARSGLCGKEVSQLVRRAYHGMRNSVHLEEFNASACEKFYYNRLNQDYKTIHGLCRFFLENTGPTHRQGNNTMLPFLINMATLFQSFVSEWLKNHLPSNILLTEEFPISLGEVHTIRFGVDILLTDVSTGKPLCLLDTKYKDVDSPSTSDVQQVIAYAKALGCKEAILVYPTPPKYHFEAHVGGDIHVWTAAFSTEGDLEANGHALLQQVLSITNGHVR